MTDSSKKRLLARNVNLALFWLCSVTVSLGLGACASAPALQGDVPGPGTAVTVSAMDAPVVVFEMKVIDENREVRVIEKPTLAALDFAAYFGNPIRIAGRMTSPRTMRVRWPT